MATERGFIILIVHFDCVCRHACCIVKGIQCISHTLIVFHNTVRFYFVKMRRLIEGEMIQWRVF